jgi:hypothetical protein
MPFEAPDELPTQPGFGGDAGAQLVFRLYSELCALDRRRLARLVEAWYVANIDQRILIESLAFELVRHKTKP